MKSDSDYKLNEQEIPAPITQADFFQAVRTVCLRALGNHNDDSFEIETMPSQDAVRFTVQNSFGFPTQPISRIDHPEKKGDPYRIEVTFMGLTGPSGVLPDHYTATVMTRLQEKDTGLRNFFDVFNNKAISFYFRAFEKYRLYLGHERGENTLNALLDAFIGILTKGLENRLSIPDDDLREYAPFFLQGRCATNLESMLGGRLNLPVRIEQMQEAWLELPLHKRPCLGGSHENPCVQLGVSAILGEGVWDYQTKFRIRIGPLNYEQFQRLLPDGDQGLDLVEFIRMYVGPQLQFDVQLILKAECVPLCVLGGDNPMRMGWTAWLKAEEFTHDATDAIFTEQQYREYAAPQTEFDKKIKKVLAEKKKKSTTPRTLLHYYKEEYNSLHQALIRFSETHQKIGTRLKIGPHAIEDAELDKLVSAAALMNAKLRYKLEDDFPELSHTLITELQPHFANPLPSMSIVQFEGDPSKVVQQVLPIGTEITTDPSQGTLCTFRTCYPVKLWPVSVTNANMSSGVMEGPVLPASFSPKSCLQLTISCSESMTFEELQPNTLRFFINAPLSQALMLYEWLMRHQCRLMLASSLDDPSPIFLEKSHFNSLGFERNEGLFPYAAHTEIAHRLNMEFFTLPEKFLFFEIRNLAKIFQQQKTQQTFYLMFYFDTANAELERYLDADWLLLGCTPVVNLFETTLSPDQRSPSIDTDDKAKTSTERHAHYLLSPNAGRRPGEREIYSVQRVTAQSNEMDFLYLPRHGTKSLFSPTPVVGSFDAIRTPSWLGEHYTAAGTDVFLRIAESEGKSIHEPHDSQLSVDVLCSNGQIPHQLFSHEHPPKFSLAIPKKEISTIRCLTPFTPSLWPLEKQDAAWGRLSHLKLNALSINGGEAGANALREILTLYDFNRYAGNTRPVLDGLLSVSSVLSTDFKPNTPTLWTGSEITLDVDTDIFPSSHLFLFGRVLEQFFSLYGSRIYFTRLIINTSLGKRYEWLPRAGIKPLL
jgi:type VI secretion system protein ImpG